VAPVFELQIAPWPKLTGTSVPVRAPNRHGKVMVAAWLRFKGCLQLWHFEQTLPSSNSKSQYASIYFNMIESSKLAV